MYETPVYNYVLRLTNGEKALAEDLTQGVCGRVGRAAGRARSAVVLVLARVALQPQLQMARLGGGGRAVPDRRNGGLVAASAGCGDGDRRHDRRRGAGSERVRRP